MSYILDALRRAERERSRGQLPDLLAAAPDDASPAPPPPPRWRPPMPWLLAGGAGALLLAWVLLPPWSGNLSGPASAPPAPKPITAVTAPPEPMPPAPSPSPMTSPPAPAAEVVAAARPASQPPFLPPPPPRPAPRQEAPAVVPWSQLAADVRATLPKLSFGGAVHSPVPASRLVIVDGQVVREGATVAPGVVLERIGPSSVVLRRGDLRYEVAL